MVIFVLKMIILTLADVFIYDALERLVDEPYKPSLYCILGVLASTWIIFTIKEMSVLV